MEFLRRGLKDAQKGLHDRLQDAQRGLQEASANAHQEGGGYYGTGKGEQNPLDMVTRGFKDLRCVLQPSSGTPALQPSGKPAPGALDDGAVSGDIDVASFEAAWTGYCSKNPRLRDPRALSSLVRKGVPDNYRCAVWSLCLGVDASAAEAAVADALRQVAASAPREEMSPKEASAVAVGETSPTEAGAEVAPEVVSPAGTPQAESSRASEHNASPSSEETHETEQVVEFIGRSGNLSGRLSELIEADVLRTFPNCDTFRKVDGPDKLRRVLRTFAAGDPELGYCQSLNFLAATFILVLEEERLAYLAVKQLLVKLGTRTWYTEGMRQLRADTAVLEEILKERLPAVYGALQYWRFDMLFVTSKWFLCLFSTALQGQALRRVWDVLLCDGIEALFRVAVAMLALGSDGITKATSHDDLVFLFQGWQLDESPEAIIMTAYNPRVVGSISRAELSQRRRKAVSEVFSADARSSMRDNKFMRGGVRPASMHNR